MDSISWYVYDSKEEELIKIDRRQPKKERLIHWIEDNPKEVQISLILMLELLSEDEGVERIVERMKTFPYELKWERAKEEGTIIGIEV